MKYAEAWIFECIGEGSPELPKIKELHELIATTLGILKDEPREPRRVSLDELRASVAYKEGELEEIVAEINLAVPPEVQAERGPDYKLVTLHTDEATGERYALLHAAVLEGLGDA